MENKNYCILEFRLPTRRCWRRLPQAPYRCHKVHAVLCIVPMTTFWVRTCSAEVEKNDRLRRTVKRPTSNYNVMTNVRSWSSQQPIEQQVDAHVDQLTPTTWPRTHQFRPHWSRGENFDARSAGALLLSYSTAMIAGHGAHLESRSCMEVNTGPRTWFRGRSYSLLPRTIWRM